MMLHLKASKGGGWSDKDLERAIRKAIILPITIDRIMHNLKNYTGVSLNNLEISPYSPLAFSHGEVTLALIYWFTNH